MTNTEVAIIENAVINQINELRHCSEIREAQGDEDGRVFFLEEANALENALGKLRGAHLTTR